MILLPAAYLGTSVTLSRTAKLFDHDDEGLFRPSEISIWLYGVWAKYNEGRLTAYDVRRKSF